MKKEFDLNILSSTLFDDLKDQVIEEFKDQMDKWVEDVPEKYKDDLKDLADRAKSTYLTYAKCQASGEEVPEKITELMGLYEAELAQYAAIAALQFDQRFKAAASVSLEIVLTAVMATLTKNIVF